MMIVLLIGCGDQQDNLSILSVEKLNSVDISSYATNLEYVKLDDSILLKSPRKVIQFSDKLFIQNSEKTNLLIYKMDGTFINLLQKNDLIGLKSIWDFSIDRIQNFIYIYDVGSLSIFKFDLDLNYQSKFSVPIVPKDFIVLNGRYFLVHNANDFINGVQLLDGLYEFTPETEKLTLLSSSPEVESGVASTNMLSQIRDNDFQFFWMYDDSVRTFSNGKLSVEYVLDNPSDSEFDDPRFSTLYKFFPASTKDYDSFYRFNSDKLLNHILVDKKANEVIEINPEFWINSIDYGPVPTIISNTENGEFIGVLDSEALFLRKDKYLKEMESNNSVASEIYEILNDLSSDDNLILVLMKMK